MEGNDISMGGVEGVCGTSPWDAFAVAGFCGAALLATLGLYWLWLARDERVKCEMIREDVRRREADIRELNEMIRQTRRPLTVARRGDV